MTLGATTTVCYNYPVKAVSQHNNCVTVIKKSPVGTDSLEEVYEQERYIANPKHRIAFWVLKFTGPVFCFSLKHPEKA